MIRASSLLAHFRDSKLFRYLFIGGVSFIIEMTALITMTKVLSLTPTISVASSFWIGLVVSFLLQKYITFGNNQADKKTIGKQTVFYGILVLFNYFFTILFVDRFHNTLGLELARTIALLLTVTWNYFVYKRIFG